MLFLALQTTTSSASDRIDTVALLLVTIFIGSVAALSWLVFRRPANDHPSEPVIPEAHPAPEILQPEISQPRSRTEHPPSSLPRWLDGVSFPSATASLAVAAGLIETLLAARGDRDLARGFALYAPELRASLRSSLGVDEHGLLEAIDRVEYQGDPPQLRSVELVSATDNRMTIRATYTSGASERYRLIRLDGRWAIESID